MKIKFTVVAILISGAAYGGERVNSYYRDNGTLVDSYRRSAPNDTTADNYGSGGNKDYGSDYNSKSYDYNSAFENHNDSMKSLRERLDND